MALTGTVCMYDPSKKFGFIRTSSTDTFFFHLSQWPQDEPPPEKNQSVAFDIGSNPRDGRECAENITRLRA
jgi:cold shock CspA family protein